MGKPGFDFQDSTPWLCSSDKSLKLCEPKFSHLSNEDNPSIQDSKELPWGSNEVWENILQSAV